MSSFSPPPRGLERRGGAGERDDVKVVLFRYVPIPVHRGQSFRRIADSVPVIADSC
jgi:hypothetical protein